MSPNEQETMTCDWCGKNFPADARACVEAGIDAAHPPEEGEEWKGEDPLRLTPEEFSKEQLDQLKADMQLNDAQLDQLLRTGRVEGLGAIVCLECQDQATSSTDH